MAGQPIEYKGFPRGLDNLHREDSLPAGAVREAVNVDLDANGKASRRGGYRKLLSGDANGLTSCFDCLVAVVDTELNAYSDSEYLLQATIASGVGRISTALTPQRMFWSDGTRLRAFGADLVDRPAWPATPGWPSSAEVQPIGGLPAGNYQVAITAVDALGRESGAGRAFLVEDVAFNGGILLNGLPSPPDVSTLRIYASDANGAVLRYVGDATPGGSYLVAWAPRGQPLELPWLEPMPPGQAVCFAMGRLWVASGRTLYFSEPLRYGAMQPDNRITFGDEITLLASAGSGPEAGLYVAAGNRTMYMAGADPKNAPLTAARATGAVAGTQRAVHTSVFSTAFETLPQTMASLWVSSDGVICLGLPGGSILPLSDKRVTLPQGAHAGATLLRNQNGLSQVITSVSGGDTSRAGASDQLVGTVYRNGIADTDETNVELS